MTSKAIVVVAHGLALVVHAAGQDILQEIDNQGVNLGCFGEYLSPDPPGDGVWVETTRVPMRRNSGARYPIRSRPSPESQQTGSSRAGKSGLR